MCKDGYGRRGSLGCAACPDQNAKGFLFALGFLALLLLVAWTAHSAWTTNNNAALVAALSVEAAKSGKAAENGNGLPTRRPGLHKGFHYPEADLKKAVSLTSNGSQPLNFKPELMESPFGLAPSGLAAPGLPVSDCKLMDSLDAISEGAADKDAPARDQDQGAVRSGGSVGPLKPRASEKLSGSFLKSGSFRYMLPPDALPTPACAFELLKILVRFLQYMLIIFSAQAPWPASWRVAASALGLIFSTYTSALGLDCMLPSRGLDASGLPVAARGAIAQEALPFALFFVMAALLVTYHVCTTRFASCTQRQSGGERAPAQQEESLYGFLVGRLPTLALVS